MSKIKQKYSPLLISLFLIITVLLTGCFNDIHKETPNISRGLIAHYTFDEENGHTAKDSSEYDINGTVYGANWTQGKINGALNFDGINDYVQIPDNQSPPPEHYKDIDQGTISFLVQK